MGAQRARGRCCQCPGDDPRSPGCRRITPTRSELVALGDQSGGGETSELVSEIDRRGYYQGFERVYGCYPGGLGALAGGFQYSEGFSVSPSAGYRRPVSQRLAGGSSSASVLAPSRVG